MNTRSPIHSPKILTLLALALALCALPGRAAAQGMHRWIGIKSDPLRSCPTPRTGPPTGVLDEPFTVSPWIVNELFPRDPGQGKAPLGLRKFCLYIGSGTLTLADVPDLVALDREGPAVVRPQPEAASPYLLWSALPELEERFLSHAGFSVAPPPRTPWVRLALLDTAPTSEDPAGLPSGRSPHGYTLASMARRLACPGGSCVAKVTTQLAMGRLPGNGGAGLPDTVRGGEAGTILDLAEAIRREVVTWQGAGQPPVLLLNLSLGWNGSKYGGLDTIEKPPADVQAVHAALEDAVCRGVTVLAAAGNRTWGPAPEEGGPLLPAAWETRKAPEPAACTTALSPASPPDLVMSSTASYRPLVYAVGAVRAGGAALGNSRPGAEPRLVAFGDHAVVRGLNGQPTAMLTGSSVATVVAATALAWVRYHLPAVEPFSAVERLYQSGTDRGRPAAFPSAGALRVRQVDVGTAARRTCPACGGSGSGSGCTAPPCFSARDIQPIPRAGAVADVAPDSLVDAASRALRTTALRTHLVSIFAGVARRDSRSCPSADPPNRRYPDTSVDVETGPQPGSNPCTTCIFVPGGGGGATAAAYIEIDPDYRGRLSSAVLQAGAKTLVLDIPKSSRRWQGARLVVTGLTARSAADLQLSFVVDGSRSATSLFFEP